MKVGNVIIRCGCAAVVIGQTVWHPDVVVGEVQRLGRAAVGDRFPQELPAGIDVAVVGDRFGQLDFLSKLAPPDIAVITMIGEAHIEFFGTRDRIADAKMEITNGLKEDGTLVYNGDEPLLNERAAKIDQRLVRFGRHLDDDLYATSVEEKPRSLTFTVNEWPDLQFTIPMVGEIGRAHV